MIIIEKNIKIPRVNEINVFGIIFVTKLNCKLHTKNIINKISAKLKFIKRTYIDFRDTHALKLLYCLLVHFQLEYKNLIWYTIIHNQVKKCF